jgi:serine/threonine protein kinase
MGNLVSKIAKGARASNQDWTIQDLKEHNTFNQHFRPKRVLGKGSDGIVMSYVHRSSKDTIAVKIPRADTVKQVLDEIKHLEALGKHDNIAGMLASCADFEPIGPAIILQLCDLGDLLRYKELWFEQQLCYDKEVRIAEITVAKLMHDISLGLDFLHNGHDICYVHNDLKAENILALTPPDDTANDIPAEPIFKITDFARLSTYPPSSDHTPNWKKGTYEYAPPLPEREHPSKPAVDIWSFGATIQTFALNIMPTESRASVIQREQQAGRAHPTLKDKGAWKLPYWRSRRQVVYRPLNATADELKADWDVSEDLRYHRPFSTALNGWYKAMMDEDPEARMTSWYLKKYAVPLLEMHLAAERELALAQDELSRVSIR